MSLVQSRDRLQLPETLETQLQEFRRRVWSIKMVESGCAALFGLAVSFLALFALDRVCETPGPVRVALCVAALSGCALVPLAIHRWIWRRRLEQLARLLTRKHPHIGDQLLGIIELVRSDSEQARSRTLCEAAIRQVADDAQKRDFRDAVPNPRHRLWGALAGAAAAVALILLAVYPKAATNAFVRLLAPWRATPRYTFAALEELPERLIVPHGESVSLAIRLTEETVTRPAEGIAQVGRQQPIAASLDEGKYVFELPPLIEPAWLDVRIGDALPHIYLEPMLRPELTALAAEVILPEYLGRPLPERKDVRGGAISLVNGSRVRLTATAGRELATAQVDGQSRPPAGDTITSPPVDVAGARKVVFEWQDQFGLSGREPFTLSIAGHDDEAPSLVCEGLPRQRVVLDSEVLNFQVRARDDFGVKTVGIEWLGVDDPTIARKAAGERILAGGGNDRESLEVAGTFSARSLGIEPQPLEVRLFVEDYLPGRERVYSPTHLFYILNAEQHAIWLTEQLSKWHRHALEVRDRELQLHETNKQLRALSPEELDQPDTRKRIETQATAERANGRRLSHLVASGEELVRQATRNPEFGVGHLEKWAEMLQILKDIAGYRMPSVADLLKDASQSPLVAASSSSNKTATAGKARAVGEGKPARPPEKKTPPSGIPAVVDTESSQQPAAKNGKEQAPGKSKSNPRLTLPQTTLLGNGGPEKKPATPAEEKVDEAVRQQQDLLAEFEKIAEELNRVLAELEGSTLVKRLKAASRLQYSIAGRMGEEVSGTFGLRSSQIDEAPAKLLVDLAGQEARSSQNVSIIMDDMQAYFERRRFVKFKSVLDEMREQDVIGSLRQIGDDLARESGLSISQCEFWSDTLDRWAEDLVDPACCGACPGCKSKGSLPPSIVLEVLQILEGEVNLREETRVAEQARPAIAAEEHKQQSGKLSGTQSELKERVVKVIARIRELPDAESDFGKEIRLLTLVAKVMDEAAGILDRPETGAPAIAAETEAIELLLQSKRINPKAGGGGGSSPGGGGGGTTQDSALTLLGGGVNDKEVREDRGISQSTGNPGAALPEEFRAGLDEYFNRLERAPGGD
jgi:hypothetical protein